MNVKITQLHIDQGIPNSRTSCPIALALKDLGCTRLLVGVHWVQFWYKESWWTYQTPNLIAIFIMKFDHHIKVHPQEFLL